MKNLATDLEFVKKGNCYFTEYTALLTCLLLTITVLQDSQSEYEAKLQAKTRIAQDSMFALSWDIQELTQLISVGRTLHIDMKEVVRNLGANYQQSNIPRKLSSIRSRCVDLIRRVTRFKRTPATHAFTFMISTELRNKKPYALPVQCIPYDGLKESDLRRLITQLVKEMVTHGMKVAGITL